MVDKESHRLNTYKDADWSKNFRNATFSSSIDAGSVSVDSNIVNFQIGSDLGHLLKLECGSIRIYFDCNKMHFKVSEEDTIILQSQISQISKILSSNIGQSAAEITYNEYRVILNYNPFTISIVQGARTLIVFNQKLSFSNERNMYDVTLHDKDTRLVGIPARYSDLYITPNTEDPYRVYNCDTGKFRPPKEFSVYGSLSFISGRSSSIFFANSSDTFIDFIEKEPNQISSCFVHETGPIDIFLFIGSRKETSLQLTRLIGSSFFPALPCFGFGHCKWGMDSQKKANEIIDLYEEHNVLFDTFWLDIDHEYKHQPFTWDTERFPNKDALIERLESKKRLLAIIQDPHLPYKQDHAIADDALAKGFVTMDKDGNPFVGPCWPGPSVYPDFVRPEVREWWGNQIPLGISLWNDMNEPSVFTLKETTMPRDNMHAGKYEHRCVHNLYGHFHSRATYDGIMRRSNLRPFVLTRSYFSGSQRHTAVWTGDCPSTLQDIKFSIVQVCQAGICGMTYLGADIGGFFGSPDKEFIELWMKDAVAVYPFLRIHAHIHSAERQQIVAESDVIHKALVERYQHMLYWYTLFYECHTQGSPVVREVSFDFPDFETQELQILVGDSMMTIPVFDTVVKQIKVKSPPGKWVNSRTLKNLETEEDVTTEEVPMYYRAGTVFPFVESPKESSLISLESDIQLLIVLDDDKSASGNLFFDDGVTRSWETGDFVYCRFKYENGVLSNQVSDSNPTNDFITQKSINKVIFIENGQKRDVKVSPQRLCENWTLKIQ